MVTILKKRGSIMKTMLQRCSLVFLTAALMSTPAMAQSGSDIRKSVVIVDYSNKQNLKGRISMAMVWGELFSPPEQYLR
jgi:hypothetical protein